MDSTQTSILRFLQQADWSIQNSGHQEYWSRFFSIYSPLFFEFTRRLRIPESERADTVQDMFVQVLRKISRFRREQDGSFRGWLFRVLKNVWMDRVRRKDVSQKNLLDEQAFVDSGDPAELIAIAEYRDYVLRRVYGMVLSEFPLSNQLVFQSLVVEQRGPQEIAKELNLSVNAIYLIRSRMLRRIREELADLLDD
jgi:RNA polymerase sigma-70 factor (ECF subfamily)